MERVEQKNAELAEKNATTQSYLAKVVSASEERSRVESALREANGKANAFDAAKARMEQEATLLQQHNEWLRAELQRKSEELLSARKGASAEALAGAEALEQAKRDAASAQRELVASKEAQIAAEASALKRAQELKAAREAAAAAEAHFDKELVTSKRLAELYKTQAEGRGDKTEELEGVLQALRDHLRELKEEHARELSSERKERLAAEKALTEAKLNFDGRVAAAARIGAGDENTLPSATLNADEEAGPAAAAGRAGGALLAMQLPDASAAALRRENLSVTELYTKYAEAADAWRAECFERKRLQSTVDGMIAELEQRAPMLAEQRLEYERAVSAHAEMRARLETTTVELRRMEAETKSHVADARHKDREARALEAQSADLSRQVKLLLHEVAELKQPGSGPGVPARVARAAVDAASVVTAELVDFKSVEELQDQNKRQLSVIRALSLDQEEQGARLKEQYQAEVDKIKREAREALDDLESRKQKTQTMVEAIVRQRDMYKALYAGGGAGDAGAVADADAAALSLAAAASASLGGAAAAAAAATPPRGSPP